MSEQKNSDKIKKKPIKYKKIRDSKKDSHIRKIRKKQGYMPISEHLEELRSRIIRSAIFVGVTSSACFLFYEPIWKNVMSPLAVLVQTGNQKRIVIDIVTSRMQDDFLIQFKVVLMAGILFSLPYILFELWAFVLPALDKLYRKLTNGILILAIILFWSGVLLARFYIWPLVTNFFLFEWNPPPLSMPDGSFIYTKKYLNIPDYLSFFFSFHFTFGASFQLPVVSMILSFFKIVNFKMFIKSWKIAVILIAILSAILTPADWVSMVALMIPLMILFFISAFLIFAIEKWMI